MSPPRADSELPSRVSANERDIASLNREVFGNGQPSLYQRLETKVMHRIDQVDRHGKANMDETEAGLLELYKQEKQDRQDQHRENKQTQDDDRREWRAAISGLGKKLDKQTIFQATLVGAFAAYKVMVDAGVIHWGTK